jgi:hypothetical protein
LSNVYYVNLRSFEVKEFIFMYKTLSVILTCLLALIAFACAGAGNSANTNAGMNAANIDNNNMPPGLSTSPLPVNGTTPGIPDPSQVNVNMNVKGATPTPGIPDPKNVAVTPNPKGTPTPGIPSPAEIKKMMNAHGNQSIQMETNTRSNGNVQLRNSMKQMQRKKP